MHGYNCERCQVNPAEVVVFGEMCVCQPCAEALLEQNGMHATGALGDVSPFGVLVAPLGVAEGLGLVKPTMGMGLGHIPEWLGGQNAAAQVPSPARTAAPPPPASLRDDDDGFPFLKVMFVLGAVGVVGVLGASLVRATRTARGVQDGALEAVKKHPEVLAAL
jgi:hypothetical protein